MCFCYDLYKILSNNKIILLHILSVFHPGHIPLGEKCLSEKTFKIKSNSTSIEVLRDLWNTKKGCNTMIHNNIGFSS